MPSYSRASTTSCPPPRCTSAPGPTRSSTGSATTPAPPYVEQFWLGILGPSTTWLLRRLAAGLDARPDGYDLTLDDTARSLGLGMKGGRHSPFVRALVRACQFRLAQMFGGDGLAVRRKLPPLSRHQLSRLPATLQDAHRRWMEAELRTPDATQRLRRSRRLALSLIEIGEDPEAAERQLHRWKFHPAMASDAVRWALDRHRQAAAAFAPDAGVAARHDLRNCDADDIGGDAA